MTKAENPAGWLPAVEIPSSLGRLKNAQRFNTGTGDFRARASPAGRKSHSVVPDGTRAL